MFSLKFDDNSIDFVVTFQVIEHIKDMKSSFKKLQVLKPGGKLIQQLQIF